MQHIMYEEKIHKCLPPLLSKDMSWANVASYITLFWNTVLDDSCNMIYLYFYGCHQSHLTLSSSCDSRYIEKKKYQFCNIILGSSSETTTKHISINRDQFIRKNCNNVVLMQTTRKLDNNAKQKFQGVQT